MVRLAVPCLVAAVVAVLWIGGTTCEPVDSEDGFDKYKMESSPDKVKHRARRSWSSIGEALKAVVQKKTTTAIATTTATTATTTTTPATTETRIVAESTIIVPKIHNGNDTVADNDGENTNSEVESRDT